MDNREETLREWADRHSFTCPTRYTSCDIEYVYAKGLNRTLTVCKDCGSVLDDLTKNK